MASAARARCVQTAISELSTALRIIKMRLQFATMGEKVLAAFATHTFAAIGSTFFSRIAEKAITGVRRTRVLSERMNFVLLIRMSKNDYYFVRRRAKI